MKIKFILKPQKEAFNFQPPQLFININLSIFLKESKQDLQYHTQFQGALDIIPNHQVYQHEKNKLSWAKNQEIHKEMK